MRTNLVLAVDDQPDNLYVLQSLFAEYLPDCVLRTASRGSKGLAIAFESELDGILIDVQMPEMNGIEMCRRLKNDARTAQVPVILVTAHRADAKIKREGLESGADDFLTKPIDNIELVAKIKVMLRIRRAEDELRAANARLTRQVTEKTMALGESQDRYRELFEHMSSGVAVYAAENDGANFVIREVNRAAELTENVGRRALIGQRVTDVLRGEANARVVESIRRVWRTGEPEHLAPELFEGHANTQTWRENRIYRLPNHEVVAVYNDVSWSQRVERALRESEESYRALVENSDDLVLRFDHDCRTLYAGPSLKAITGVDPAAAINKGHHALGFDADVCRLWEETIAEVFTSGEAREVEFEFKGPRRPMTFDWRVFPERASDADSTSGGVATVVAVARDVTTQKALERQLRHAVKMEALGTLAGGIAHDFNNILQGILGYATLVKADLDERSTEYACIEEVLSGGLRAGELVKQILAFSRGTEQKRRPLAIQLIVREALALLRSTLPMSITIHQDIDTQCGSVLADATQIHQVVMNLAANACHAMARSGGTLTVEQKEVRTTAEGPDAVAGLVAGRYVRLTIRDTGHGMSRSTQSRIFEPYFTTKEKESGTGLGLAVVHGIVKAHGGEIQVASQLDEGSVFDVYLPLHREAQAAECHPKLARQPRGFERVLFVDDDEALARLGKRALGRLGYVVETNTSSVEALERVRTEPDRFDIVITDFSMPALTGVELARRMIEIRPGLPIILCTGFSEAMTAKKAQSLGFSALLTKPVVAAELATAIRRTLDGPSPS